MRQAGALVRRSCWVAEVSWVRFAVPSRGPPGTVALRHHRFRVLCARQVSWQRPASRVVRTGVGYACIIDGVRDIDVFSVR